MPMRADTTDTVKSGQDPLPHPGGNVEPYGPGLPALDRDRERGSPDGPEEAGREGTRGTHRPWQGNQGQPAHAATKQKRRRI